MEITIKPAFRKREAIQELLVEYTSMVVAEDARYADFLELQRFDSEVAHPEKKYCRLYLVEADGTPAGCIAMQKLDESRCEMKRLYIRPAFRGKGIARCLVEMLLADARKDGYEAMVLDTFPFLRQAVNLYRDLGFYEIPSYNDSPLDSTIYMRKDLCPA